MIQCRAGSDAIKGADIASLLDHLKDESGHAGDLRPKAFEKIVEMV